MKGDEFNPPEAYEAYGRVTDFKNFRGDPMPNWNELPPKIQEAWTAACARVEEIARRESPIGDLRASQSALLASIAASADAAREMVAASSLPGATAVLEQIAANARDVATALLQAQADSVAQTAAAVVLKVGPPPLQTGDAAKDAEAVKEHDAELAAALAGALPDRRSDALPADPDAVQT